MTVSNLTSNKWHDRVLTINNPTCHNSVENLKILRILLLDLDDTLIPTSWLMTHYKNLKTISHYISGIQEIRRTLLESQIFQKVEEFMVKARGLGIEKIAIVTNAARRTVEEFYFNIIMPELRDVFVANDVEVVSTSDWIETMGTVPSPEAEEEYRRFFTIAKKNAFSYILRNTSAQLEYDAIDLISVGDQYCEMSAATMLALDQNNRKNGRSPVTSSFENNYPSPLPPIRYVSLVLIIAQDMEHTICPQTAQYFPQQTPSTFLNQLYKVEEVVCTMIRYSITTKCGFDEALPMNETCVGPSSFSQAVHKPEVPCWVPLNHNITVCGANADLFQYEYPFYLPLTYTNLVRSPFSSKLKNESDRTNNVDEKII